MFPFIFHILNYKKHSINPAGFFVVSFKNLLRFKSMLLLDAILRIFVNFHLMFKYVFGQITCFDSVSLK